MKTLYIVRHAKSSWKFNELPDRDRPLKGSGIRDALNVADYLAENSVRVDAIFSSPAVRALHTALMFSRRLGFPFSDIQIRDELYLEGWKSMREVARSINNDWDSVMLFGHNPDITHFINHATDTHIRHIPTTGMVSLEFPIHTWAEMDTGARLLFFEYPKKNNSDD